MGRMDVVRIAVAGCGRWGINYVRTYQAMDGVELVACCDPDPATPKRSARQIGSTPFFKDHRRMLAETAPDAVVVATPASTHAVVVADVLHAGSHVLVEKPLTNDSVSSRKLVDLAAKKKRLLMVGHIFHYNRAVESMDHLARSGQLGTVRYLYSVRTNLGPVRNDVNVLWDLAPHDVSTMMLLAGDDVAEVTASGQSYLRPGIADIAFGTIYFRKRKVIGHLQVSWLDPHKVRRLTVIGDKRMAVFDDVNTQEPIRVYDRGVDRDKAFSEFSQFQLMLRDGDIHIPHVSIEEPLKVQCAHFAECVRTGKTPKTDGKFGLQVVRVLEALDRSLTHRGRPVKIR